MGLIKNIEQPTGVVVTYWEIGIMQINVTFKKTLIDNIGNDLALTSQFPQNPDIDDKTVLIHLFGYLNKATKDSGKTPVAIEEVQLELPPTIDTINDLRQIFYELIRTTEKWNDAIIE